MINCQIISPNPDPDNQKNSLTENIHTCILQNVTENSAIMSVATTMYNACIVLYIRIATGVTKNGRQKLKT